ncbi:MULTISPECIES: ribosome small subunit-dependent GTPase A [unclassified Undibacterium]|uniref:ribosome small subunit-dependent GTPase A n=1 Tax=unclassified Undibacterium TaxID=2630295 RepID=UPI002AC8C9CD|nr:MULTISPECIES: ribosome small subunit-dependent GTPase A [unclassified Undibacterium]MEB0138406.1 ribosome small subunit-dependent GTPase A [Undibacterium sp. CCC2.1]MEB0171281.1 ribosome small subunit-dependent GTPase A [Undibacterium sp. CCC1.1]MEB0176481.1 ribosome small subunit-dependent GTPase A [Undibacterium sp. CCC3.4]MEB0214035.1 ribosome small subunit-dependent GTPase A [Undibacterium sp. 5I2]WPX43650.1 ribosome small subunit-dependent GTPase A [Undibacterium sp. CCC3.4]
MAHQQGLVIAAHGRHYLIQAEVAGETLKLHCVTRGKKTDVSVGDVVELALTSKNQGVIEAITPRKTLLYRSDQYKSKMLAANLSQLVIVVATEPSFTDDLVSRALVAAESSGIKPHIILNKIDVTESLAKARQRVGLYAGLGYPVHEVSVRADPEGTRVAMDQLMRGQSTILIGQSGMGKSSLINLLIPDAEIATREISAALDTGKHTTTFTRLYQMDQNSYVIDSPGFQEFGLHQLSEGMLERAFPEFLPHLGKCKFYNCHHHSEPQCAVLAAVKEGTISAMRHQLFEQLVHESAQTIGY